MSPIYRHGPNDPPPNPHGAPLARSVKLLFAMLAMIGLVAAGASVMVYFGSKAQQQSDQIASCRTSFSSELVTGPTAAALQAIAMYGIDSQEFVDEVTRADPQRFQDLTIMSRTDPARFLRICASADLEDHAVP